MADMLVSLLDLPDVGNLYDNLKAEGIEIRRACTPNKFQIVEWVKAHSGLRGASECDTCFSHHPVSCFIAVQGNEIIGYACYNSTAPDFFGPTRVLDSMQGKGVGKALLLACLQSMRECGYIYAIIGGIGPREFYIKTVNAIDIPGSTPGLYKNVLK
ncbi:MAG: GNAT family N-acetyltransferase [Lachnospiraceae bacterium]|jgi:GNAT superfamily N-acetyltransferase